MAIGFGNPCTMSTAGSLGFRGLNLLEAVGGGLNAYDHWQNGDRGLALLDAVGVLGNVAQLLRACFAAGTPLLTPEGSKPIEQFQLGDLVLSRSEHDPNAPVEAKVVEEVFVRTARIMNLHVGRQVIRTTAEHPFWVRGNGWVPAGELQIGDLLSSHDGQWAAVEDLLDTGEYETVYNLRVADSHTYFVGTCSRESSVWAHNTSCDSRKLGRALEADGQPNLTIGGQAAHVVPTGAFSSRSAEVQNAIATARAALASEGIGLNSASNGFWATAGHNGAHTDAYFLKLGEAMQEAMKAGTVVDTLKSFRLRAIAGAFL